MLFCKNHRRVKADYRKVPGHVQNVLYYGLARGRVQKVDLRGVVPRHSGAVVSVVNVADVACLVVHALEDHGAVALRIVMVFQVNADAAVVT